MKTHLLSLRNYISLLLLCSFALLNKLQAQALTGTKTIPGDYATIEAAVSALNTNGVGSGGVTFNVAAGHTETLTKTLVVTATGTASDPIVFQKSGGGANPLITAYAGVKAANSTDSVDVMWAFEGSDYVTVDGIDLTESGSNTTLLAMMEVGYGLYKISGTDGANNNTIKNCTITLNRNNDTASAAGPRTNAAGSVGIELINATRVLSGTAITVTTVAGASSNNKFYGNTIQNCHFGMLLSGFAAASPYTLADVNNDIGGSSALTGNNILNFGGGAAPSNACGAILINNQWSFNISYNTVNNNNGSGINNITTNRGIWLFSSSAGASCDITHNTVSIKAGSSTSAISWCLDLEMAQSGTGNTINVNNNQFLNCSSAAASTVAFTAIWLNTAATTVNVNNNYFYGWSYDGTGTTQVILSQLACGTLNIMNNTIDSTTLWGSAGSGTHHNIGVTAAPTVAVNIIGNTVTRTALNTSGAGSKTLYGIFYTGATPATNITDNTVNDITRNGTTGGTTVGIYQAGGTNGTSTTTMKRNTVSNLSISGTGTASIMTAIQVSTGTIICDSNTVFNIFCLKSSGTSTLYGIYDISSPNNESFSYNTIHHIVHSGAGITYGLYTFTTTGVRKVAYNTIYAISSGSTVSGINQSSSVPSIYNNRIYDISTTGTGSAIASGISLTSSTAGTALIYNNIISGITAPASNGGATSTARGLSFTSTSASTTLAVYNNTIMIDGTSSGTNFSSTVIFHTYSATATSAALDLRNNVLVNNATPTGTGIASVIWRSAATSLANFSTASNNNLVYAGTPAANHLIYYDGTNSDQTLPNYITRVTPRDTSSVTEAPTFISTLGTSPFFLHLDSTVATYAEATARNIAAVTNDFGNRIRAGNAGYTGTAGMPDIGAWEANHLGQTINQMVFDSAITDQQLGAVPSGTANNIILRIKVYGSKGYNALVASALNFSTGVTSNNADITSAKVYYTGGSSTFSTSQLYGSVASPGTTYSVTGNQRLITGVNYFWVTYDISGSATGGNLADAIFNDIILNGTPQTPINGDPSGSRTIKASLNGTYDVGPGFVYGSITEAITDLKLLGVTGPVIFNLKAAQYDSVTTTEVFPITLSAYPGSSAVNTVTIRPEVATPVRIVSIGMSPTFVFNGGSHYIIDGRQGSTGGFTSGNNLIIEGTNKLSPTISFINDADSNMLYFVDVKGADTLAPGNALSGVINIGTTTGTLGNDRNTIRRCHIHESVDGYPTVAISSIGSAASVAANNDAVVIDSSDIYNFYNPAAIANTGIYVGANNGTWTIHYNRFYQTAIRNYSGGATHRALWITPNTASLTSASGFVITHNYIGGDNTTGTGWYEMRGTGAFLFNGMDISVGLGVATQITNNTITNIIDSTSSTASNAFTGINLANGNVNVLNNMIGSSSVNGAITFGANSTTSGGAMGIRTGGGTGNTFNIAYNTISGFDLYGATATTAPEFFGLNIFNGTNKSVHHNMIGDTLLPNSIHIIATSASATVLQRVAGIYNNPSVAAVDSLYNNIIANIVNDYAGSAALHSLTKGILIYPGAAGTFYVANNLVRNISTSSQTTGTGFNATLIGIASLHLGSCTITGNTVQNLTLTGPSLTAAVQSTALFYSAPTTGNNFVTRNLLHSQSISAVNPAATINGMDVAAGNGIIANNMIRLGVDSNGSAITTGCIMRGITKNTGNANIFFNTVYVGGTGVDATSNRTYAFQRTGAGTDSVRNNIFVNARSNASTSGGNFAVALNNNTALNMNYNLLRGDSIGLYNTTAQFELSDWKVTSGVDASSISGVAGLKNPTGSASTLDLHIDAVSPTPIEAYGSPVLTTASDVDFDGQIRASLTPVDLGADAGNFIPSDIATPVITYTTLTNTLSTGNRTLTATITDATGVYTVGANRPRVYFKKMYGGGWNSTAGTLTAGTGSNGTWSFTIDSVLLGGLVGDDSVYYYVVAQDSTATNNLGSNPAGAEGANVNSITTEPIPNSYKIIPILGNITLQVGTGYSYTTLTGNNGLFAYLNSAVLSGDITVEIKTDIEEPGTNGLNELMETGLGGYKVTIVPDAAAVRSITGGVASNALIRLNGSDRIKIDGSFAGSGRYLRFMNRTLAAATFYLQQDAHNDTIANCIIEGVNNTVGMITFWNSTKVGGTGNDSNAVIGCIFRDTVGTVLTTALPNTCIFSQGSVGLNNDYNTLDNNEMYNFGYNAININNTAGGDFWTISNNKVYQVLTRNVGMTIFKIDGGSGHTITGNSIGGTAADRSGVAFQSSVASSGINLATTVSNTNPILISNNIISNIGSTSVAFQPILISGGVVNLSNNTVGGLMMPYDTITTNGTASGIHYAGGAGSSITIDNNLVSNIKFLNASTLRNGGISVTTTTSGAITISNNTVRNLFGANTGTSTATNRLGGILVTSGPVSGVVIEGNTISNIQSTNTGATAYAPVGIMNGATGATYSIVRNRIFNIGAVGTGTGTSAPIVHGIQISSTANNCVIANNQIVLGESAGNESKIYGISDFTTGANLFANNSIFINGNTTTGANSSYGIFRNSTSNINARNNIIYNKRTTGGTGRGYAVGSVNAVNSTHQNYNLFVVSDTAFIAELGGIGYGWSALQSLYTTTYHTNWAERTATILPELLFVDTLVGNLDIITTNPEAWYANGKGIALAAISGDYGTATGVRSTTIATGATDIGADEFTPSSLPPIAFADNAPVAATTTTYYFASRPVAKLGWDIVGTLPGTVDVRYYSGVNHTNVAGGTTYMNAYWDIQPTGGSGFESVVTLMADTAILGSVANLSNLDVARYMGTGTTWESFTASSVNSTTGFFNTTTFTGSLGIFTGTDGNNNPLPVQMLNFTATNLKGDVMVDWTTASESNNSGFEIERSLDGRSFKSVGFVKGAGNSNKQVSYMFNDEAAFVKASAQVLYYRLKQVDMNGAFNYSDIARVSVQNKEVTAVSAYPNPFTSTMQVTFGASSEGLAQLRILNIQGMVVAEQTANTTSGINRFDIEGLTSLERGMYFVELTVNGETTVVKVVKN